MPYIIVRYDSHTGQVTLLFQLDVDWNEGRYFPHNPHGYLRF
jgi:hypothetical protein